MPCLSPAWTVGTKEICYYYLESETVLISLSKPVGSISVFLFSTSHLAEGSDNLLEIASMTS